LKRCWELLWNGDGCPISITAVPNSKYPNSL
jgi:hypothetical protein